MKTFTAEERDELNRKLENYLRPIRFREPSVTPDATDGRTPFDSDFARVALSAPVRRLQDKTQVFPLPYYDFVRNRLTHSLEVLCIARGLGLGVEKVLSQNGLFEIGKIPQYHHAISSILGTASLIHDIGNPPFGHKIEKIIQNYFQNISSSFIKKKFDELNDNQKEDFYHIEGNVQGFRILRHLALAKDEFSYNLTMPTMATIVKYPYSSKRGNKNPKEGYPHEQEKFGYLNIEEQEYFKICDTLGMRHEGHRHPLTYLLEAADDIAYSVCDLEDVYKDGLISPDKIKEKFELAIKEEGTTFKDEKIKQDSNYKRIIKTAIVTARNAPAHERILTTLQSHGISVDMTILLGYIPKARVLNEMKPHMFFDDDMKNFNDLKNVAAVHIPFGIKNIEETK